jgi:hypothetical protein
MKSTGVSFPPNALFTLENLPAYKLGSQQLNCRGVLRELSYTEKVLEDLGIVLVSVTKLNNI